MVCAALAAALVPIAVVWPAGLVVCAAETLAGRAPAAAVADVAAGLVACAALAPSTAPTVPVEEGAVAVCAAVTEGRDAAVADVAAACVTWYVAETPSLAVSPAVVVHGCVVWPAVAESATPAVPDVAAALRICAADAALDVAAVPDVAAALCVCAADRADATVPVADVPAGDVAWFALAPAAGATTAIDPLVATACVAWVALAEDGVCVEAACVGSDPAW